MTKERISNELPQEGFIRLPQILNVIPVGKSYFWQKVKEGKYPQPVKFSAKVSAWRVREIRALIEKLENGEV